MVWIVIPAKNEEKTIRDIIKKIKKFYKNIVVVDDGSSDRTAAVAKKDAIILRHILNLGKGAALKTGCDFALKSGARSLVAMDADGQHDPEDIKKFISALEGADIVFGYRTLNKDMPAILRIGNNFINWITRLLYNIDIKDTQCGFRAFTAAAYRKIRWNSPDYSMESEMIANSGKHKLRYRQVPIKTVYKDRYKGTTVLDGIKIVFNMISWRLRRW